MKAMVVIDARMRKKCSATNELVKRESLQEESESMKEESERDI